MKKTFEFKAVIGVLSVLVVFSFSAMADDKSCIEGINKIQGRRLELIKKYHSDGKLTDTELAKIEDFTNSHFKRSHDDIPYTGNSNYGFRTLSYIFSKFASYSTGCHMEITALLMNDINFDESNEKLGELIAYKGFWRSPTLKDRIEYYNFVQYSSDTYATAGYSFRVLEDLELIKKLTDEELYYFNRGDYKCSSASNVLVRDTRLGYINYAAIVDYVVKMKNLFGGGVDHALDILKRNCESSLDDTSANP